MASVTGPFGGEWWREEEPSPVEADRVKGHRLDLLVTHSPPVSAVREMLARRRVDDHGYGELPPDYASVVVEDIWRAVGSPPLVCGHMHHRHRQGNVLALGECDTDVIVP